MTTDREGRNALEQGFVEDPTDEDFAKAAALALRKKDLRLAIQQVSAAIALRPLHEPYLRLLDDVVRATPGPLALVELPAEGVFYGLCAVRARVLARVDRLDEAMSAVLQAASYEPSAPFVTWAVDWAGKPKSARKVQPRSLAAGMIALARAVVRAEPGEGVTANLEAALSVAERVAAQHEPHDELLVARSRVMRALGRPGDALALLEAAGATPSWEIAVERAGIHHELGDRAARVAWLERARDARPEEPSTYLDLGDAELDDGALVEARESYDRALALDPASDWARLGAAYTRALASRETAIAERPAGPQAPAIEARALAIEADLSAYAARIADPIDPLVPVIRAAGERAGAGNGGAIRMRVRTDRAAAPSARLAFGFAVAVHGREGALVVDVDPAAPALRAGPLWKDDTSRAEAAVPRPPDAVLDLVREIAMLPFEWAAWCARAAALAGTGATMPFEHAAAHVTPPPPGFDPVRWVHGFQIAAALLCASVGPPEARLERLLALTAAADDWTSAAALLGLRALARAEPATAPALLEAARALLPAPDALLPPFALALAVLGGELCEGDARRDFLRLRARVRAELDAS